MDRPASVPADAVWCQAHKTWDQGRRKGEDHLGPFTGWTKEGLLDWIGFFDDEGWPHGPVKRFRADGGVEREGTFDHGTRTGVWTYQVGDKPDGDTVYLDYMGRPAPIRRWTMDYGTGRSDGFASMRFYAEDGAELDRWGDPIGDTPPGFLPPSTPELLKRFGHTQKTLNAQLLEALGKGNHLFPKITHVVPREVLVRDLIAQGAEVNAAGYNQETALHYAARIAHSECVTVLLKSGAEIGARTKDGKTPLIEIVEWPYVEVADRLKVLGVLLAAGASLTEADKDGAMLLHRACWRGPIEVVDAVAQRMKNVNVPARDGFTPLHIAAAIGSEKLTDLLLKHGADPEARTTRGDRPYEIAKEKGYASVLKLLKKAGTATPVRVDVPGGDLEVKAVMAALKAAKAEICDHVFFEKKSWKDLKDACEAYFEDKKIGSTAAIVAHVAEGRPWWAALGLMKVLQRAVAAKPAVLKLEADADLPAFHHGDLEIAGALHVSKPTIITGSLRVKGHYSDQSPESMLIVGGSLEVGSMFTEGDVAVDGDLTSKGLIYGFYNDQVLKVGGVITAPVVIEDDHHVDAMGGVDSKHHFERDSFDAEDPALRKIFVKAAFTKEGLDRDKVADLLHKRKPVLL